VNKKREIIPYLKLLVIFILGLIWVHIDVVVILFAFSAILIAPVILFLFVYYIMRVIKAIRTKDNELRRHSLFGLMSCVLFFVAPVLSTVAAETYLRSKSETIIEELEEFKTRKGTYPESLADIGEGNPFRLVEYRKVDGDHFTIQYTSPGIVRKQYASQDSTWNVYGWND
jgi:hypothetical protein